MQKIVPFLWYNGKAQEAATFYTSIFKDSKIISSNPQSAIFELQGREFYAFNGGPMFEFTPAISMFVNCDTQEEIDYYWYKLSEDGTLSRCGWLQDKFGLSWQVVPAMLPSVLGGPDPAGSKRAMQAMLSMVKLEIAALQAAYDGK